MANKKHSFDYDFIIIGSGAAGSPAASMAAQAGYKVAVVESNLFGGESPNWGDVPLKAMLHASQLYDEARHGARFGIRSATLGYNFLSIKAYKDLVIKRTGAGNNRTFYEKQGIDTFHSTAHFLSPNEISINRRHLSAKTFLVATGSYWQEPEIIGLKNITYHTPQTMLDISRPPKSLAIIGGGSTAVEYAQLFASFGTKVYIFEKSSRLLPEEDSEAGEQLAQLFSDEKGIETLTQSRVLKVEKDSVTNKVTYSRGGTEKTIRADEILVTTGRTPSVDIGLENAAVKYTPKGIEVDDYLQTSSKHIFAAGDVLGNNRLVHTAVHESRVVANNLLQKQKIKPDYVGTPSVTYTCPGVASVGLTEDDCLKRDLEIKKSFAPLTMVTRSNTSDFRDGFVKLIANRNGTLLGATVMAPHAAEIIHELALAVRHGITASELANTPHAFLSWSEAVRIAALRLK